MQQAMPAGGAGAATKDSDSPEPVSAEYAAMSLAEGRRRRVQMAIAAAFLLILAAVPLMSGSSYDLTRYGVALAYIMAAIGLNLAFGYAGELAIGHSVIMAGGAYAAGMLSALAGWSAVFVVPAAVLAGMLVGLLMMLPGLRVQGWYLALITLFTVLVLPRVVILGEQWTGGEFGLTGIKSFDLFGLRFPDWMTFEVTLVLLALVWLAAANFARSGWGHRVRALRDARRAAEAVGINLTRTRFVVYAMSAFPAALAGVLLAYTERFVNAESFGIGLTLLLLTGVVLGGTGSIWGPIIGMVPLIALSFWVGPFSPYNAITLGIGLMVGVIVFTNGLATPLSALARRFFERPPSAGAEGPRQIPQVTRREPAASHAGNPDAPVILRAEGVGKRFGGLQALDAVGLELRQGRLCGLVGPNGSGKSTFLNAVSGFIKPDSGSILIADRNISGLPAHEIAHAGVGRSFQVPQLVDECTALENIEIGLIHVSGETLFQAIFRTSAMRKNLQARREAALSAFRLVGLPAEAVRMPVAELPLGLKRVVEVARAVASEPQLLLLDEPAAGLNDEERRQLGELMLQLRNRGMTILVVEHNVPFVMEFCDELVLLEEGHVTCRADLGGELPERLVTYLNYAPSLGPSSPGRTPAED